MQQEVYGEVVQGEIVGVVQPAPVIPTATPVTTQPGFSSEVELGAYKGFRPGRAVRAAKGHRFGAGAREGGQPGRAPLRPVPSAAGRDGGAPLTPGMPVRLCGNQPVCRVPTILH